VEQVLNLFFGNKNKELENIKRYTNYILLCILLHLYSIHAYGQIEKLTTQLESYTAHHLQEKVFVHTDKENYVTGEIIWFKLFVTDALFNKPLNLSKIAYVEVLDRAGKPILQSKIGINNSMGTGSFLLPYSLQSGNYLFRSYTGLMKDFSADYYFEKQVTIINPLKKPDWSELKPSNFIVQFFPEGGNLVNGIESKLGFKVNDQYGNSFTANGIIEDEQKQKIVRFETTHFGMGQFLFKPVLGKKYHANIEIGGKKLIVDLPNILLQGTVIQLSKNPENKIIINVQTSLEFRSVDLVVHNRQVLTAALHQELSNGKFQFVLPDSLLGEGVSQITLFDEQHHPLCERLFFKKPTHVLQLDSRLDTKILAKRRKVDLAIDVAHNNEVTTNLSLSVYLLDSLQSPPPSNILSYLWLESDLRGEIESPEYYFSNAPDLFIVTENLLLTQGWRRFQWDTIVRNVNLPNGNHSELNGHLIWARVTKKMGGQIAAGITVYLSLPGEMPLFNQGISDRNGLVLFNIPPFFGINQLILQTNSKVDSNYRIDLIDPFSTSYSNRKLHALEVKESIADLLKAHSIQSQVGNIYYADQQQTFSLPELLDTVPFFGKPTHRYYLDDYTRFITMEEVFKEYIEGIKLRKNNNGFNVKLYNESYQNYFETEPLVLLDGVPIIDINQLIAFDPLKIKKIDLLNQQFFLNMNILNGILSCNTYKGDLDGFTLDPNALVYSYEGLQLKRVFYQPSYNETKRSASRLPDFRNVLLWMPDITIDNKGKQKISFYTSDVEGKFLVMIQGINNNGDAGSSQLLFEVKN
jgi:hypothetical protein